MSKSEKILLISILAIGFVLRFFQLTDIPFSNDELSALNRLHFPNFSEMILGAVVTDGHPAGVQTFLWFYTHLFGITPWIVKLPFLILGFLALPLYFLAAKNLSNTKIALFILAFLATLQYPIFYTQTIRPYSSGQFLSALTIFLWSKLLIKKENINSLWIIIFLAIAIFLSLSNHYFSGFLAFYLLPIGIYINRNNFSFRYFTPWLIAIILYIPQLKIFIHQLKVGSPGWLEVPTFHSLVHHIQYCFHFSTLYFGLFAALFLVKLFHLKGKFFISHSTYLWLLCYLIPILTAYFYSIYRAPIFQDSIFIFSFFFLFLFLGDIFTAQSYKLNTLISILAAILIVNVCTLIIKRQHYKQYYNHGYSKLVKDVNLFKYSNTPIHVFGFEPFFFQYYQKQYHQELNDVHFHRDLFFADTAKNKVELFRSFRNFGDSQVILANAIEIPDWVIACFEENYTYSIRSLNFGSEVYLFSKTPINKKLNFFSNKKEWPNKEQLILTTSDIPQILNLKEIPYSGKLTFPALTSEKYIESKSYSLEDLTKYFLKDDILHSVLQISSEIEIENYDQKDLEKLKLICQVSDNKDITKYYAIELFTAQNDTSVKLEAQVFLNFNHFNWPPNGKISCYIENNMLQKIKLIKPISLKFRQGNSNIYSLTNDF